MSNLGAGVSNFKTEEFPTAIPSAKSRIEKSNTLRENLSRSVNNAYENTFFYKRLFRKTFRDAPPSPETIASFFFRLPFTSKEDVIRNYPYGFLGIDLGDIATYFESSGTSGNTIHSTKSASFFSHDDLRRDAERRFSPDLIVGRDDVVLNALPFALTSSGLGFQLASQRAGAMTITADSGSVLSSHTKHIDLLKDLGATIFVTSLPLLYSTLLLSEGRDPRTEFPKLRAIQLCGLPTLKNGRRKIAEAFGVPVFDTYGLSEFGATTFTSSDGHSHVYDDDFFVEIIDPRTGEPVNDGVGGEIVVTTLSREASPKIRYRTGDFGYLEKEAASDGRTQPRLVVKGRLRDAALFGERFRLPIDFEEVIYEFPSVTGLYQLRYEALAETTGDPQTRATVTIDVLDPNLPELHSNIEARLREEVTPNVDVILVRTGSAQAGILDQERFANVRTVKSAVLDDKRPQEWLVTY